MGLPFTSFAEGIAFFLLPAAFDLPSSLEPVSINKKGKKKKGKKKRGKKIVIRFRY